MCPQKESCCHVKFSFKSKYAYKNTHPFLFFKVPIQYQYLTYYKKPHQGHPNHIFAPYRTPHKLPVATLSSTIQVPHIIVGNKFTTTTSTNFGCERHLQPENDGEIGPNSYIFFDAKVNLITKANIYNNEYLPVGKSTSFGVFGYGEDGTSPIFDKYTADVSSPFDNVAIMHRPARNAAFQYDNLALWGGGVHSFYAYYINGSEYDKDEFTDFCNSTRSVIKSVGVRPASNTVYVEYVQPTTVETMVDIMTAKTSTSKCDEVIMNFEHRLFAIDIVIRNAQTSQTIDGRDYAKLPFEIKDVDVEFTVPDGGLLYFDEENTNSPNETTCQILYDFIPEGTDNIIIDAPAGNTPKDYNLNNSIIGRNTSFLLLPCQSLKVKLNLTFENTWAEEATYTFDGEISPEGGFLPGRQYEFIVTRMHSNGDEMEFVPTVTEIWEDKDVDHTFN